VPFDEQQISRLTQGCVDVVRLDDLRSRLALGRPLVVKVGFDPTAPDLHLGHTVLIRKMKHFQDLGHRVVFVVGDFTAMIGDPTGRSKTRPALTSSEIERNAETYKAQVFKLLDPVKTVVELSFNTRILPVLLKLLTVRASPPVPPVYVALPTLEITNLLVPLVWMLSDWESAVPSMAVAPQLTPPCTNELMPVTELVVLSATVPLALPKFTVRLAVGVSRLTVVVLPLSDVDNLVACPAWKAYGIAVSCKRGFISPSHTGLPLVPPMFIVSHISWLQSKAGNGVTLPRLTVR